MSLYSSLTQVLAPFAARLNGLLTGYDGTVYSTPGEAVRQQIADLHVLIGDEPGTAIDSSAIGYGEDGNVEGALDGLNGRLTQQGTSIGDLSQLNTEEKSNLVAAINEAAQTGSGQTYDLPTLKIYGDISQMTAEKNEPKIYQYIWENPAENEQRTGYCSMKWQGQSSLSYPKKNYTMKFFHDAKYKRKDKISLFDKLELKKNKWVIKASWVDRSMARNIVSCRLWGQLVKSRNTEPEANLTDAPNYGAINGYPIKVYVNNRYHGLYSFNIPKDEDTFAMEEDNPLHCAICGTTQSGSTAFRLASVAGWEVEVPDAWQSYTVEEEGQTVTKYVSDGLVSLINFVMTATDEEFKANLNNYLDVESVIDYYLMAYLDFGIDSLGRNLILLTYDGGNRWICSLYDADTTWGNGLNGGSNYDVPQSACPETYECKTSLLWERLETCFGQELYDRWSALRKNIFSVDYIKNEFSLFWDSIPEEYYDADIERWKNQSEQYPNLPQWNVDFKTRIFNFIEQRAVYCDAQIKAMRPRVACTSLTLDRSSIRFTNGSPITIVATVEPENTTDDVIWTCSDNTVATVTDGIVYPLKNGTATITATCGEQTATCAITVVGLSFSVTLVGGNATLSNTEELAPNASYTGTLTANTGYEFTSVVVTMGDTDITATAYSNGTISIDHVTGDIVVTVTTEYHYDETGLEYRLTSPLTLNGSNYADTGFVYNGSDSLTIAFDFIQPDVLDCNIFGAACVDPNGVFRWDDSYRGVRSFLGQSITCGMAATARLHGKVVIRYNSATNVISARSSVDEIERTSSNSKSNGRNRPDIDKFANSLYIGARHDRDGSAKYSPQTGKINDFRIYSRRWTDEEVKNWLGVDSLSTIFTDDLDQ